MKYGECASCGYPVESDYVICPNCHQRLKNLCTTCHHALDPAWTVCPYCATPVGARPRTNGRPHRDATNGAPRAAAPQQQARAPRSRVRPDEGSAAQ